MLGMQPYSQYSQPRGFLGVLDIEQRLKLWIHAAQRIDDILCPLEVIPLPRYRPVGRRRDRHVPQVAYLVREFHELAPFTDMRGWFRGVLAPLGPMLMGGTAFVNLAMTTTLLKDIFEVGRAMDDSFF